MLFSDRADAGQQLAKELIKYRHQAVVYALPRGGLPVGAEIAQVLEVPLDMILVRKIGHPSWEEYAVGAVAENAEPVWNQSEKSLLENQWLDSKLKDEQAENKRRREKYFVSGYDQPEVADRTAIIVDDGIATGLTMQAAIKAVRQLDPAKIVVAVPVAPVDTVKHLKNEVDEVIVLDDPLEFKGAVGAHYYHFPQLEDDEVIEILYDTRAHLSGNV